MNQLANTVSASGTKYRWSVLNGTFLSYFYDSYDLAILAVVMPVLMVQLNIDLTTGSLLSSATMIGAAIGSIIIGWIASKYGNKIAIIVSLIEFGIGSVLIYLVDTWQGWLVLRFVTGIGIGGVWGPCVALLAQHWSPKYMARANSFMLSTFAIGWIAASIIGRWCLTKDWRIAFLIGGFSIFVALYVWFTTPDDRPQQIVKSTEEAPEKYGLFTIFEKAVRKTTILAFLMNFCQLGGFWGAANWIPTFLVKERGMEVTQMTSFLTILYVGMFIGYQVYGMLGDKIGRKKSILLCFILDCIAIPIYLLVTDLQFLFWFSALMGMQLGGVFGLTGAFYAELFPAKIRALAGGFCFNVGRLGAVIAPIIVGYIGQHYGLAAGIITSPVMFALGIVVTLFLPETLSKRAVH